MSPLTYQLCAPHWHERKELAFKRWQESGYRDVKAHDEFVRYYEMLSHPECYGSYRRRHERH